MVCRFGRLCACVCVCKCDLNGQRVRDWKMCCVCSTLGIHGRSGSCQKWAYKAITYNNYAFVKCNQWFTIRLSKFSTIASSSKHFILIILFEMRHSNLNVNAIVLIFSFFFFSEALIHANKTSERKINNNEREKNDVATRTFQFKWWPMKMASSAFDFPFATAPFATGHLFIIAHKNNRKLRKKCRQIKFTCGT